MQVKLERTPATGIGGDAVILLEFEGSKVLDAAADLYEAGEITGKAFEMSLLHGANGFSARRVLLAGAGKREKFTPAELRNITGAAVRHLKVRSVKSAVLALDAAFSTPEHVAAAVEGALLADFECDQNKSDRSGSKFLDSFTIAVAGTHEGLEAALERGQSVAEGQNLARVLANEPPNRMTPAVLAESARTMAAESGLACEVLDESKMRDLGFGALLGVSMGSAEPPALIILRYTPEGASPGGVNLGLVGKGVTFDTGGISIKPAEGMEKMKYDMAGGAAVIGAMQAIARLKPSIAVTALIPAVENMPGSRAQRPGDIVTTLSGKTVEVLNTDAEGRMILADALTYAQRIGCTHLVDAATLTGAIVVALGSVNTGVFTNDSDLLQRWSAASKAGGEKMWEMPMDDEYRDLLKSTFADMQNIGGRYGGAISAALFLKEFADPKPWIHLDIAGTAWLDDAKAWMAKGPTGAPVRSFVNLAMNWT